MNRRDFLKLTGLAPLSMGLPVFLRPRHRPEQVEVRKNVLVLVFDALSAYNMSLYGYARETTPNIDRLAKRAIVYRNHFSPANFTSPGTASLLTGSYPWTHRALQYAGRVERPWGRRSVFNVFQDYYRLAYSHNDWAYILLQQLSYGMQELVPLEKLYLAPNALVGSLFDNDHDLAAVSWARNTTLEDDGYAYSLFLSHVYSEMNAKSTSMLRQSYPRGVPEPEHNPGRRYTLEQAIDWIVDAVNRIPSPFFVYFHVLPPHALYRTSVEFYNRFQTDGYQPPVKPTDAWNKLTFADPEESRREYDEFVLYVDKEFNRLLSALEESGAMDNTWVVMTSDHGEMFERGLVGHGHRSLHQPVIRIPLLIFEPGQKAGMEVQVPTSAIDLLPTLATVTGQAVPSWAEGLVLPPFGNKDIDLERSIFAVQSPETHPGKPLRLVVTMLVKGRYKLHYYFGYPDMGADEFMKLYDIQADREELLDLSSSHREIASRMLGELKAKIAEVNGPYL